MGNSLRNLVQMLDNSIDGKSLFHHEFFPNQLIQNIWDNRSNYFYNGAGQTSDSIDYLTLDKVYIEELPWIKE